MQGRNVRVRSSGGGEFDCYRVAPRTRAKVPAIVIASAVHGVNADVRAIAEEFASHDAIAAAPDLFWRSIPGPLARDDDRTKQRSQPRPRENQGGRSRSRRYARRASQGAAVERTRRGDGAML